MSRLMYQGVPGVEDTSFAEDELCTAHDTQSTDEDPKLREECGVCAIHGHPDAARQAYLALYALQHRGQESGGIATADGHQLANIKGMASSLRSSRTTCYASCLAPWPSDTRATPPPVIRPC